MEVFKKAFSRPNDDLVQKDDVSSWTKYGARALGTVGGGVAIFLGVWVAVGILLADVSSFIGGVWQMIAGFTIIVIEGPCCCMCLDFVGSISAFMDRKPFWQRGALYVAISLPPIMFAFCLSTLFGSGLIFATGVLYGLMGLGKKGAPEDMAGMASSPQVGGAPDSIQTGNAMEDTDVWRPT